MPGSGDQGPQPQRTVNTRDFEAARVSFQLDASVGSSEAVFRPVCPVVVSKDRHRISFPLVPMARTRFRHLRKLISLAYAEDNPGRAVWKRSGKGGRKWRQFRPYEPPGAVFDITVMTVLAISVLACLLI